MKILIVTPFLPYSGVPHAGGVAVYENLKLLSQGHEVYLLARLEPSEIQHIDDVKNLCKEVHLYPFKTPANKNPITIIASYITLGLKANRLMKKKSFDLVQVEFTETGFAMRRPRISSVLVAHDVISKPARRRLEASKGFLQKVINLFKLKAARWVERFISRKFDMILTMSTVDRDILMSLDSTLMVEVSTNLHGLDFGSQIAVEREPLSILFVGAMQRDLNVDAVFYFYQKVFPIIRREMPGVKFYVAGSNPPEVLLKMAEDDPSLIVTGFVKDIREYFFKATVFVSPMLVGGGIIVKNLQAMSCGLPVVTTSIGNEGIEAVQGRDIFVADEPDDFAEKVLMLLKDPELRRKIGFNGRSFARDRFSDDRLFERRIKIYEELCGG